MPSSSFSNAFRALRHRNYRLFLLGQFISLVGTWMQMVALGWLVYRLTRSPFLLGLTGFLGQIPSLVVSPLAGVLADRWSRHRLVIATQAAAMAQAAVLTALVLTGRASIGAVLALSLWAGLVNAVDVPARQAFLIELVNGRDDLANAIALNSTGFNLARLVGPSVAGLLIGAVGEGPVFLLNAVSYLAVLAALLAIRVPPAPRSAAPPAHPLVHLREGFRYVAGFAPIRTVLLLAGAVSLLGVPFSVLLPIFAAEVLHGGAHTLGFLTTAVGLGALFGALWMAMRQSVRGLGKVIVGAVAAFAVALGALAAARSLPLALAALALAGAGMMIHMAASNTIVQTLADVDKRGRVMSFYTVAFMGTTPLGSMLAGALAARIGAPWTVALGGVGCLAGAALFARALPALAAQVRPIYRRMGIIPEIAAGLQAATPVGGPAGGAVDPPGSLAAEGPAAAVSSEGGDDS